MLNNLRELPNPYDFANPVHDARLFFGRTEQIADISYYLNHAQKTNHPIHLAFVGARASGKTSFLNIAELEARRRDFCTVRINEGDVETDLDFFRKLFHSVLMAAFHLGAFGGKGSKSYFAYLDLISTYELSSTEDLPLIFAYQLARALKADNKSFHVADDILNDDLKATSTELKRPVVILFDECNVLRANRIILEKLRNVFMNMSGYMLVFAATEDFFPIMDEVFSPIMRQFKKVEIGPFKSFDDVYDCIYRPIRLLGFARADAMKLIPRIFTSDIDTLSGRRPYEIQLICHTLFRRCQEGSAKKFSLDLVTIQAIQREITSGQNIELRPLIHTARSTKRKILSILNFIGATTEPLTAEQWWRVEYFLYGQTRWTESLYMEAVQSLIQSGLLIDKSDGLHFGGDDLDRIYIKYLAHQKQVSIRSNKSEADLLLIQSIIGGPLHQFNSLVPIGTLQSSDQLGLGDGLLPLVSEEEDTEALEALNLTPIAEDLLSRILLMPSGSRLMVFDIFLTSFAGTNQTWLIWDEPDQKATLKKLDSAVEALRLRGESAGITMATQSFEVTVPSREIITERIRRIANDQTATRVAGMLMRKVPTVYIDDKDHEGAKRIAETAFAISQSRLTPEANNIGYLYLSIGEYDEARKWFEAARQYDVQQEDLQLVEYNFGVLSAMMSDIPEALRHLRASLTFEEAEVSCVYRVYRSESKLLFEEIFQPKSVSELAKEAIETIESMQQTSPN